ncbi:Nudix hydrolase incomplete domain containing protein [Pandoravirus salinus]|uniref:Nudix hydrolase incomplete domain containing protein n=1 Tax=Pandoravirus salinus TaxID=1349410 RepID=S4VU58_9VIRU|nr:MutT/NUDIX hydrolase [Pandoravirus salinus]AGO84039.1 Nudix hydrolase incomplete domain containing protein [Pandoravirus salinus]
MGIRSPLARDCEACDADRPPDAVVVSSSATLTTTTAATTTSTAAAGASVLCYAVAPHTGELFFLLGKESGGAADARLDYDGTVPSAGVATATASSSSSSSSLSPPDECTVADTLPAVGVGSCVGTDERACRGGCSGIDAGKRHAHADDAHAKVGCDDGDRGPAPVRCDVAGVPFEAAVGGGARRTRRTHRWCDFGGRIEPGETQEEAAAREFFEETLGLVCTDSCARSAHRTTAMGSVDVGARPGAHGDADRQALAADLAAGCYTLRVRTCLNHGAEAMVPRRYHVTFVKRIPWTPGVVLQFARLRCELAAIARAARRRCLYASDSDHAVSDDDNNNNNSNSNNSSKSIASAPATCLRCGHGDAANDGDDADDDNVSHTEKHHGCATDGIYTGDEPAARAAIDRQGRVRAECIEKDYLQFWSVRRLWQALDNGGCFRREHLRPLFMPTIAVVLDVMAPRRVRPTAFPSPAAYDSGGGTWRSTTRVAVDRAAGSGVYTVHCKTAGRRCYPHHRYASQRDHGDNDASDHTRDARLAADESSLSDECDCLLPDEPSPSGLAAVPHGSPVAP